MPNRTPSLEIIFLNAAREGIASLYIAATKYDALPTVHVDYFGNRLEEFQRSCRFRIDGANVDSSEESNRGRKENEIDHERSEARLWRARLRRLVETIHWQFSAEQNQAGFSIRIANIGAITARNVRIKIQTSNGVLLCQPEGYGKVPRPGPVSLHVPWPRPYRTLVGGSYIQNDFSRNRNNIEAYRPPLPPRDPAMFYGDEIRKHIKTELRHECAKFRRADPPEFLSHRAFLGPVTPCHADFLITCVVTADNLAQPIQQSIPVKVSWSNGDTFDRATKLFTETNVMYAEEHDHDETVFDWLPGWPE